MHVLEVRALARATRAFALVEAGGHLDLDHLRAPVGELSHRGRSGTHARQVEDLDMRKRRGSLHAFESTLAVEEEIQWKSTRSAGACSVSQAVPLRYPFFRFKLKRNSRPGRSRS